MFDFFPNFFHGLTEEQKEMIFRALFGLAGVFGTLVMFGVKRFFQRRKHRQRDFRNRINGSANIIEGIDQFNDDVPAGSKSAHRALLLRTWFEDNSHDLLDNPELERLVSASAKYCTDDFPFVLLGHEPDQALLQRTVLNILSSRDDEANHARLLEPSTVNLHNVVFALTFEPYGGVEVQKFRIMIIKEGDLRMFLDDVFASTLKLEAPSHKDRIKTLKTMAELHFSENEDEQSLAREVIGTVEIALRKAYCNCCKKEIA